MSILLNVREILEASKEEIIRQVIDLYFRDDRVLSLGYSGGKDSSCTLAIVLEALLRIPKEKRNKTLYVLYSDTLMEILPVQAHTYKSLKSIEEFAKANGIPVKVMHAKPKPTETMWVLQIGKGMRPPSRDNRYCTSRLKTDVQENMLFETFGTTDIETISIVGSRKDESSDRAKRLTDNTLDGHLKGHSIFSKSLVFAPIEDYSTEDVWSTLRTSDIGIDVLGAEELWSIYASTQGEGEECQTILGNASDNGKNPGCSSSQGRFGCWNCALVHKKDKALTGMQREYPYIKYLIRYRDWSFSTRDGNWDRYRDVYNHRYFTRLQYNIDNHRFGMTVCGGLSIKTRMISLTRLLYTEEKVNESVDFRLISDDEIDFIQHRWLLEGDFNLTTKRICAKHNRSVRISSDDEKLLKYSKAFMTTLSIWKNKISFWFNIYADNRFAVQFVKQYVELHSYEKLEKLIEKLVKTQDAHLIAEALNTLQVKNQFYPSESLYKLILNEWKSDEVSYVTQALINDHESSWKGDENEDVFEDPNISMEDKYAVLDNWNTYQGEDSNEKFVHEEYMRHGGQFQYVHFRERQNEENRSKNKKRKASKLIAKSNTSKPLQQTLLF